MVEANLTNPLGALPERPQTIYAPRTVESRAYLAAKRFLDLLGASLALLALGPLMLLVALASSGGSAKTAFRSASASSVQW